MKLFLLIAVILAIPIAAISCAGTGLSNLDWGPILAFGCGMLVMYALKEPKKTAGAIRGFLGGMGRGAQNLNRRQRGAGEMENPLAPRRRKREEDERPKKKRRRIVEIDGKRYVEEPEEKEEE